MIYDQASGNLLTSIADVGGVGHFNAVSNFTYTNLGLPLTAINALGVTTLYGYDNLGDPTSITHDLGGAGHLNQTTVMGYSTLVDVVSLTDPKGNVYASAYDADRRLTTSTTPGAPGAPAGRTTAIAYDADGRVLQTQISAGGAVLSTTSSTYTLTGEPATATDANGNVTHYAYDVVDRVSSVTDPLQRVTSFSYDALSRRTGVFNTAIQAGALWAQAYTPDGLAASVTDANSHSTGYLYDGFDRLGTTTWPDTSTEVLAYDADSNVLTRKTRKGDTITLTYDTLNRPATKAAPSEATVTYAYDLVGRLAGASDTSAAVTKPAAPASYAASYAYDALNRPITSGWTPAPAQTLLTPATVSFTHAYDSTNRRVGQTATDNGWWSYPTTPANVAYAPNSLNQYGTLGSATPTYDGNGNLTFDGTLTYGYDAESRLTSIAQSGTTVATYAYGAQGRRKSKTVGATTTLYATDADNREVLEYAGTGGALQAWYAFGPGPDAVLNRMNVVAASRQTMIPDIQGSIIGTLDSGGTLAKAGAQPYGENPTVTTGSFRYTGRRFDPETGGSASQPSGLYYYRARMYSPAWGRFLQPDPIGYGGGANLYSYVGDDPLNLIDPLGLTPDTPQGQGNGLYGGTLQFAVNTGPSDSFKPVGGGLVGSNTNLNGGNLELASVTINDFPGEAGGAGHVGIGVNTDQTVGFYPKSANIDAITGGTPGVVHPDNLSEPHYTVHLDTTPQQDEAVQNYINQRSANPGNYRLFMRNCANFCETALGAASLHPSNSIIPNEFFQQLLKTPSVRPPR